MSAMSAFDRLQWSAPWVSPAVRKIARSYYRHLRQRGVNKHTARLILGGFMMGVWAGRHANYA